MPLAVAMSTVSFSMLSRLMRRYPPSVREALADGVYGHDDQDDGDGGDEAGRK